MRRLSGMKLLGLASILLFSVTGGAYILLTQAETPTSSHFGHAGSTVAADNTVEVRVTGGISNSSAETYHITAVFFSDINRVEFISHKCLPPISCSDSNWRSYTFGPDPLMDAKVTDKVICITVPPKTSWNSGDTNPFMIFKYKLKDPKKAFWVYNTRGVGRGSCASNPAGANIQEGGGSGSCLNYTDNGNNDYNPYGCLGTGGIGPRGNNPFGNFPDPNPGESTHGPSNNANGQGANNSPRNSNSNGGGSTANQQGNNPDDIPTSESQGDNEQPDLEPSPFFDGKEFKRGSDQDTLGNTVSSAGKKIIRTWPIVLGVLILGGAAGFGYWKWRSSKNG